MYDKTIEQRVSETILQSAERVTIGSHTFDIPKPTTAALIKASAAASKLPRVELNGKEDLISEVLRIGRDCEPLCEVIACLLTETRGAFSDGEKRAAYEAKVKKTTTMLLEECTPSELQDLSVRLLNTSEVSYFFGLTTFLVEVNMTKTTKVDGTTAFGL